MYMYNMKNWSEIPHCWKVLLSSSNPGYTISCLPVEPSSSASSENVYMTMIRLSIIKKTTIFLQFCEQWMLSQDVEISIV